jgi:N-acetylglutamate synthase-like GNAT family acetyltransferase
MPDFTIREATQDDAEQIIAHIKRIGDERTTTSCMEPGEFDMSAEDERQFIAEFAASDTRPCWSPRPLPHRRVELPGQRAAGSQAPAALGISVHKEWRDRGVGTAMMRPS